MGEERRERGIEVESMTIEMDLRDVGALMREEIMLREMLRAGWKMVDAEPVEMLRETVVKQRIFLERGS